VLLQGRGYYERIEVRDLYHALRVGIEPKGLSFAAFLRGPFAQLELDQSDGVLKADNPLLMLQAHYQEVFERLELIRQNVRGTPLSALKYLIREPFIGGKKYVDFLDSRARENVDALLFTVAQQPPGDIELLLDRLQLLSRQTDAGDVPQSGEGIKLLTVHKSKGLEWPLVAVFDLGRKLADRSQAVYVHEGHIVHQDSAAYSEVKQSVRQRDEEESYRLLYVAASRARDVLIMTGSSKGMKTDGWLSSLELMKLGPASKPYARSDFVLQTHLFDSQIEAANFRPKTPILEAAPWIDRFFGRNQHPPVSSPSRVKQEFDDEPLPFSDPDEGERLPGRSTTVGTLVHYAISQNWSASNPAHRENLKAQEVMFPFTPAEQDDILSEVVILLSNYESMLGQGIASLNQRLEDYPELPMAIPQGKTVWQGIIDRLYYASGQWFLEDYKTDQDIVPERYFFQLGVYLQCIQQVKGLKPQVQLVFLREKQIISVDPTDLEWAVTEVA
jgi:ATP-dependent exoDNAse (exonuclease V) beta subunit